MEMSADAPAFSVTTISSTWSMTNSTIKWMRAQRAVFAEQRGCRLSIVGAVLGNESSRCGHRRQPRLAEIFEHLIGLVGPCLARVERLRRLLERRGTTRGRRSSPPRCAFWEVQFSAIATPSPHRAWLMRRGLAPQHPGRAGVRQVRRRASPTARSLGGCACEAGSMIGSICGWDQIHWI